MPEPHHRHDGRSLSWGASDPIFSSLGYLDELLAVEAGGPLDTYRERLGEVVGRVWPSWPAYTRAVACLSLRGYHWHTIGRLSDNVDDIWALETDVNVLGRILGLILRRGGAARKLHELFDRLGLLTGADELANNLGHVLGDAAVRFRGERETHDELKSLAELCDVVLAEPGRARPYLFDIVHGVLWGAARRLQLLETPGKGCAEAWAPLAKRSVEIALDHVQPQRRLEPVIQGVMAVLELRWADPVRTWLYDELATSFEFFLTRAGLGDFSWFHYLLGRELNGDIDGNSAREGQTPPPLPLAPSDEVLLRICRAAAGRVLAWSREQATTQDLGWVRALRGHDTADLIRLVFRVGRDRRLLQRSLPPVIDLFGEAGYLDLATDLRVLLRRG